MYIVDFSFGTWEPAYMPVMINIDACHLVEESNSYPQNNIIHDKSYMIYHSKVSSRMHPRYGDDSNLKEPSPHYSTYIIENEQMIC